MPIYLRKFYIQKMSSAYEEERKQYEDARKKSSKTSQVSRPGITRKQVTLYLLMSKIMENLNVK